jgi:hypothetical protein
MEGDLKWERRQMNYEALKLANFCPLVGLSDPSLTSWFPVTVRVGLLSSNI